MLELLGLTMAFGGRAVLKDFELVVTPGEVVALVGPNGAGKSTLLRCVIGTEAPDSGEVRWDDRALDTRDARVRGDVCAILDDSAWFPDLTVREHLDLLARADGVLDPRETVSAALTEVRLGHVADQLPGTLSSGQRQRLVLASAMVRPWRLLLVDEPEQRLDDAGRAWLAGWLREQAAGGAAVLMACHDPELIARARARRVAVPQL